MEQGRYRPLSLSNGEIDEYIEEGRKISLEKTGSVMEAQAEILRGSGMLQACSISAHEWADMFGWLKRAAQTCMPCIAPRHIPAMIILPEPVIPLDRFVEIAGFVIDARCSVDAEQPGLRLAEPYIAIDATLVDIEGTRMHQGYSPMTLREMLHYALYYPSCFRNRAGIACAPSDRMTEGKAPAICSKEENGRSPLGITEVDRALCVQMVSNWYHMPVCGVRVGP